MNILSLSKGKTNLAMIEGSDRASIVEALQDISPDLANLAITFVYGDIYSRPGLTLQHRQLATVAALAAMGGLTPQLKFHIAGALNVGCPETQMVELMLHLAVYAGFPAALNGTAALREVFTERGLRAPARVAKAPANRTRYETGVATLREVDGNVGEQVIDSLADISPDLGRFIVEFAFGDIYARPEMDLFHRELVTIAALMAMGSANPQLKVHMNGFLNVGGTTEQMVEVVTHIAAYAGFPRAINAALAAKDVLLDRANAIH